MKTKALFFTIITFIITVDIFSQTTKDSTEVNSLKGGKWAIQFEIGSFVNPNYFESVMFSVKPQLSKHFAFRVGFSYDFKTNDGDQTSNGFLFPEESKQNNAMVKANLQYYVNPKDKLVFYFGLGPIYKYGYYKYEAVSVDVFSNGTFTSGNYFSSRSWSVGAVGILGVEWFIHNRISFLAEYNISAMFGKYTSTRTYKFTTTIPNEDRVDVDTENANTNEFRINIAKIGLSVYF